MFQLRNFTVRACLCLFLVLANSHLECVVLPDVCCIN